jgi:hypothetical protein
MRAWARRGTSCFAIAIERLGAIDVLVLASDAARFVTGAHAQVAGELQQR